MGRSRLTDRLCSRSGHPIDCVKCSRVEVVLCYLWEFNLSASRIPWLFGACPLWTWSTRSNWVSVRTVAGAPGRCSASHRPAVQILALAYRIRALSSTKIFSALHADAPCCMCTYMLNTPRSFWTLTVSLPLCFRMGRLNLFRMSSVILDVFARMCRCRWISKCRYL